MEEIGFLEFIFDHVEAGIEISIFFTSIGIKKIIRKLSDLVLYPVSYPISFSFDVCMGGNEHGNLGRFKPMTSGT